MIDAAKMIVARNLLESMGVKLEMKELMRAEAEIEFAAMIAEQEKGATLQGFVVKLKSGERFVAVALLPVKK